MSNHGENSERFADMFRVKPKKSVIPDFLLNYGISSEVKPSESNEVLDPFPPELLTAHMHEFESNGKKRRVAELDMTVTYKIVKRGRRWFEAVMSGHKKYKALIEINSVTEECSLWHTYDFTGIVRIDCTYSSYIKIYVYPAKATDVYTGNIATT